MNERIGREEIALRILCAYIRSGRPTGSENVREAFALSMTFEEHSDKIGARPFRGQQRRSRYGFDDDGE